MGFILLEVRIENPRNRSGKCNISSANKQITASEYRI